MRKAKQIPLCDRAEDPEYAKENDLAIDVDYYVGKQILPPLLRLLEPLGIVESDLVPQEKSSRTLLDFCRKEPRKFITEEDKQWANSIEADMTMMASSSHITTEEWSALDTLNAINIMYLIVWEDRKDLYKLWK